MLKLDTYHTVDVPTYIDHEKLHFVVNFISLT